MADEMFNLDMLGEDYPDYAERQPIWVDKDGIENWCWKNITDNHFSNIITLMQRRSHSIPAKWKREAKKRGISINLSIRSLLQ